MNEDIKNTETLARVLFSPSFFYDGRISPTAFNLVVIKGIPETGISVLRTDQKQFKKNLDFVATHPRLEEDSYCGYTKLNAEAIRSIDLGSEKNTEINIIKTGRMKSHAEITLEIEGTKVKAGDDSLEFKTFRKELAKLSKNKIFK